MQSYFVTHRVTVSLHFFLSQKCKIHNTKSPLRISLINQLLTYHTKNTYRPNDWTSCKYTISATVKTPLVSPKQISTPFSIIDYNVKPFLIMLYFVLKMKIIHKIYSSIFLNFNFTFIFEHFFNYNF